MRRLILIAALVVSFAAAAKADFQSGVDAIKKGDYATALREFKPLAEQGMAAAQTNLGLMYSKGMGVTQDDAYAFKWYRVAAEQGQPVAQNNLGAMFVNGLGGPKDPVFGTMWLMLAAENGYAAAGDAVKAQEKVLSPSEILIAKQMAMLWKEKQALKTAHTAAATVTAAGK